MTFVPTLSQIPAENQIRRQLMKIVFGHRVWCPNCNRRMHVRVITPLTLWRCIKCRNKFSLTSVTWLSGCKLPLGAVWALIWCWQRKISVQQVQELLHLSIPTIRRWYGLFRDNLPTDVEIILEGGVQMDEMFQGNICLLGAKDIARKKVKFFMITNPHPAKVDAATFIQNYVKPGSILATDGSAIYRAIENWWPVEHIHEIHKRFEFEITSQIEGMWGALRTFIRRMYHHVTRRQFAQVVAEYETRYNHPELFQSPLTYLTKSLYRVKFAF